MNGLYGRRRIETSIEEVNPANLLKVLARVEPLFEQNRAQIRYLHRYYLGCQPILDRVKEIREEINNKPVENHAQEIVNFYTGYIFGHPCVYVKSAGKFSDVSGSDEEISDGIQRLNTAMQYEGKETSDRILGQWMIESGVGYRIIVPDKTFTGDVDEVPFLIDNIDSDMAYVVRSSLVGHRPLMGVMHIRRDSDKELIAVYTDKMYFEVDGGKITKAEAHVLGTIPIIEYELNPERMGAFEPVLPLLDQINNMAANRCDGIEQFVQSFMKFVNCEIDEEKFDRLKSRGAIAIKSTTTMPADVDIVTTELNQSQSQVLVNHMLKQVCAISGMPSVEGSEAASSDSVGAVIVRNGWNQTEARAEQIEQLFRKSERDFLRVALTILNGFGSVNLSLADIDLRFPRRQYENLQSKSSVFNALLNAPVDPEIAFKYCGMFADPQSEYESSKKYLMNAGKQWDGDTPPVKEPVAEQPDEVIEVEDPPKYGAKQD